MPDYSSGESENVLENSYTSFSGSFGGSYRAGEHMAVAFSVGRGFRAPDVFELHAFGEHGGVLAFQVGDPGLDPETSLNTDLSIRWRSPHLEASATVYRNAVDNYIFLRNNPGLTVPESKKDIPVYTTEQTDAVLTGFEMSVKGAILSWLAWETSFSTVDGDNELTGAELPLMPPTRFNSTLTFSRRRLGVLKYPKLSLNLSHTRAK